jgi:hypothetical protein
MSHEAPVWKLVLDAARRLGANGSREFKLDSIVAAVQALHPEYGRGSIQPVVQGMTRNAGKGPTSPCGKPLLRVRHGWYVLESMTP